MSPHQTTRSSWNSPTWLLLLLCLSLLGWRVGTRVQQYHPLTVGRSAPVAFFDVNERNASSISQAAEARPAAQVHDLLYTALSIEPSFDPTLTSERAPRVTLPLLRFHAPPYYSNPPPPAHA